MRKPAKSAPLGSAKIPDRDRHGFRGVPGPATFDIYALPDTAPLTDHEVAAVLRVSTNTTASWRRRGIHLKWITLPGGLVRSTVGSVKAFLAMGKTRAHASDSPPPTTIDKAAPRDRRSSSRRRVDRARTKADTSALQEQTP